MELFIDTANVEEIKEIYDWGVITGVTTNPTLVAKEGKNFISVLNEIIDIVDGPISAEVIGTTVNEMVEEAEQLSDLSKNIVIKIPMTEEGLKAVKILSKKRIKTNVTLIFSSTQALLAAQAGATYVSPFVGRLDDISFDGIELIREISDIFTNYDINTQIIAASIRHPLHVTQAALAGADIATIPYKVLKQMVKHPLTDKGVAQFLADWESVKSK